MNWKGKKNLIAGALFVGLTVVVVAVGLSVGHKKSDLRKAEGESFLTSATKAVTDGLGKFDDFRHTASIEYSDETMDGDLVLPENSSTVIPVISTIADTGSTGTTLADPTATVPTTKKPDVSSPGNGTTLTPTVPTSTTVQGAVTGLGDDYAYAYAGFKPKAANMNVDYKMLLVNRNYLLPQDYSPELAEAAAGTGVKMDARVAPYYQKMYDAAKKDGITLTPLSGHRRISTQKTNFENKIAYYQNQGYGKAEATQLAAKIILPPGTSEHNAGLAMDIISLDVDFEETKEFKWLQEHAQDYGFILRYPKDKQNITEITYEPWHWRFVGPENAKKIKASGKCLEEYLGVR